jgi:N12 class adenine-specific DNA methylase
MLQVRDAVREVFRTQLAEAPDESITEARLHLNRSYRLFVSRFGPLNATHNVRAFANDPDQPLLLSLEEFNPETQVATKTAIFDRRTLERYRPVDHVDTASEALLVSLNETGAITNGAAHRYERNRFTRRVGAARIMVISKPREPAITSWSRGTPGILFA